MARPFAARGLARRWIHLPVETKAREFESRLLLACLGTHRGFGSVVGVKGEVARAAHLLPRGVFLEKSVQLPALEGLMTRIGLGHIECCLDEEGLVYVSPDDYTGSRLDRRTLDCLTLLFAWGEAQASVLRTFHPPIDGRISVTGNPRVDLWRPEFRSLHDQTAGSLRARYPTGFVLVSTAFAMVNNARGPEYHVESLRQNGRLDTAMGEEQVRGYLGHSQQLFDALMDAVRTVATARPSTTFVVRPHPSENPAPWEYATRELSNVVVCREGAVTPWLLAADVVIHNNSTTGLEAALLDRPTIAFVPITDPRFDQNIPNRVSTPAADIPRLVKLIDQARSGSPVAACEDGSKVVAHHIASLTGPLACDRILDEIDRLPLPSERLDASWRRKLTSQVALANLRLRRRHVARPAASPLPTVAKAQKFPPTELDEVIETVERLRAASGRFGEVRCTELTGRVFAIEPASEWSGS